MIAVMPLTRRLLSTFLAGGCSLADLHTDNGKSRLREELDPRMDPLDCSPLS